MVKAWLGSDVETTHWAGQETEFDPVTVGLDGDDCGTPPVDPIPYDGSGGDSGTTETNPLLTIRVRTRTGYDDNGVPLFDWSTLLEGRAIVWTERSEFDDEAGFTQVVASAVMQYEGDAVVVETAGVWDDLGQQWRIRSVRQVPGRVELDLERIEQT